MHVDANQQHRQQQYRGFRACQRTRRGDPRRTRRCYGALDRHGDEQPFRAVQRGVEDERVDFADDVRVDHEALR